MPNVKYETVDAYIAAQPPAIGPKVQRIRRALLKAIPSAEEVISYNIPAYKVGGRVAFYVAAWKAHFSFYPSTKQLEAKFKKELAPYETSGKGTVQFPWDNPLPLALLTSMAKFRVQEMAKTAKVTRKAKATKKR